MKRKILIPVEVRECVECSEMMSGSSVQWHNDAGEPLCSRCALSCAWCEEPKTGVSVIHYDGAGRREIICYECAVMQKEVSQ